MPTPRTFDPFRDVKRAQDFTREGVIASGELLRPELLTRIGDTLGGLNEIGALRSGGTKVALEGVNREFTDRFGQIASRATMVTGPSRGRKSCSNHSTTCGRAALSPSLPSCFKASLRSRLSSWGERFVPTISWNSSGILLSEKGRWLPSL